jgi:hypothetical protein
MKLSKSQQAMHWSLWKRVKAKLMPGRSTWTKHEEDQRRHELYVQALGEEKSLTQFTNDDLDQVKAAMLAIVEPGNLKAQLAAINGQRTRLLFGIRRLAPADYVDGLVARMNRESKLGGSDLEALHPPELAKVLIALKMHERRGVIAEPANPQRVGDLVEEPF